MTKKQFDVLCRQFPKCRTINPEFWSMLYNLADDDDSKVSSLVKLPTGYSVDCEDIFGIVAPTY